MTIKELYEWAIKNNVENCEVEIQYRDGGGTYYGTDDLYESDIVIEEKTYGKVVIL